MATKCQLLFARLHQHRCHSRSVEYRMYMSEIRCARFGAGLFFMHIQDRMASVKAISWSHLKPLICLSGEVNWTRSIHSSIWVGKHKGGGGVSISIAVSTPCQHVRGIKEVLTGFFWCHKFSRHQKHLPEMWLYLLVHCIWLFGVFAHPSSGALNIWKSFSFISCLFPNMSVSDVFWIFSNCDIKVWLIAPSMT